MYSFGTLPIGTLPPDARERNIRAAAIESQEERLVAIDAAKRLNRELYPEYYNNLDYCEMQRLRKQSAPVVVRTVRSALLSSAARQFP